MPPWTRLLCAGAPASGASPRHPGGPVSDGVVLPAAEMRDGGEDNPVAGIRRPSLRSGLSFATGPPRIRSGQQLLTTPHALRTHGDPW